MKGKVKFFNETKGFGFIAAEDGEEYFVHQTDIKEGVILKENDSVVFDVTEGDKGLKAVNVTLDTEEVSEESPKEEQESAEEVSEEQE